MTTAAEIAARPTDPARTLSITDLRDWGGDTVGFWARFGEQNWRHITIEIAGIDAMSSDASNRATYEAIRDRYSVNWDLNFDLERFQNWWAFDSPNSPIGSKRMAHLMWELEDA